MVGLVHVNCHAKEAELNSPIHSNWCVSRAINFQGRKTSHTNFWKSFPHPLFCFRKKFWSNLCLLQEEEAATQLSAKWFQVQVWPIAICSEFLHFQISYLLLVTGDRAILNLAVIQKSFQTYWEKDFKGNCKPHFQFFNC